MYSNEINSTQSEDDGKNEKRSMESEWKPKRKCRGMEVTADILLINKTTAVYKWRQFFIIIKLVKDVI